MKVVELIDCLMTCDPELPVVLYPLGGDCDVTAVEEGSIVAKARPLELRKVVQLISEREE